MEVGVVSLYGSLTLLKTIQALKAEHKFSPQAFKLRLGYSTLSFFSEELMLGLSPAGFSKNASLPVKEILFHILHKK